jgi:hypothetical protein
MAMIFFTHNFTFKLFHIKNYIEVIIATEIEKPSFKNILIFFSGEGLRDEGGDVRAPDEGDGGLLPLQDEDLHRPEDRPGGSRGLRLHGIHQNSFPEWILSHRIAIKKCFFSLFFNSSLFKVK